MCSSSSHTKITRGQGGPCYLTNAALANLLWNSKRVFQLDSHFFPHCLGMADHSRVTYGRNMLQGTNLLDGAQHHARQTDGGLFNLGKQFNPTYWQALGAERDAHTYTSLWNLRQSFYEFTCKPLSSKSSSSTELIKYSINICEIVYCSIPKEGKV